MRFSDYSLYSEIKADWLHPHLHHKRKPHSPEPLLPCTHSTSLGISATTWSLPSFDCVHPLLRAGGWRLDLYRLLGDVTRGPLITQPDVIAFIPVSGNRSSGLGPLRHWPSLHTGLGHNMHSGWVESRQKASTFPENSARVFGNRRMPDAVFILLFHCVLLNDVHLAVFGPRWGLIYYCWTDKSKVVLYIFA